MDQKFSKGKIEIDEDLESPPITFRSFNPPLESVFITSFCAKTTKIESVNKF